MREANVILRKGLAWAGILVLIGCVILAVRGKTDRSTPLLVVGIVLIAVSRLVRKPA